MSALSASREDWDNWGPRLSLFIRDEGQETGSTWESKVENKSQFSKGIRSECPSFQLTGTCVAIHHPRAASDL